MPNGKNELKILEWNIHGAASMGWNSEYEIKKFVVNRIMYEEAHIVILNEFVISEGWDYFQSKLKENDYVWFITHTTSQNGILIAVKKIEGMDFKDVQDYQPNLVSTKLPTIVKEVPNFLQITIKYKNKPLTIIGTRIRPRNEQFKKEQYQVLKEHLESLEGRIICAGDFNLWSSFIVGNYEGQWNLKPRTYNFYTPTYSWLFCGDSTKKEPSTWSHVGKNKKTGELYKTLVDHIVAKGVEKVINLKYSWDFVNENNGYGELRKEDYKSDLVGLPDHAILLATIEID